MKINLNKIINFKGQALIESIVILLLILALLSGFFVTIYKSTLVVWIEYNLNQALNCENSKILQTKNYQLSRTNTNNSNLSMLNGKKINILRINQDAHRKNKNCLIKAKANIQKITTWENFEISRNKFNGKYEVKVKWNESKVLTIKGFKEGFQTKALPL